MLLADFWSKALREHPLRPGTPIHTRTQLTLRTLTHSLARCVARAASAQLKSSGRGCTWVFSFREGFQRVPELRFLEDCLSRRCSRPLRPIRERVTPPRLVGTLHYTLRWDCLLNSEDSLENWGGTSRTWPRPRTEADTALEGHHSVCQ